MTKVIAFDLDGTLLNGKNEIINKSTTLSYLKTLKELGYKLVINTGRLDHDIAHICKQHGLDIDVRISQNGCVINDDKNLEAHLIDKTDALSIYHDMKAFDVRVELNTVSNRYWHTDRDPDFPREFYDSSLLREDFVPVIQAQPCVLFLVIGASDALEAIRDLVQENYHNIEAVKTSNTSLEIVPKGTSKGKALRQYFETMTLYAIGDSENDFSMFDEATKSYIVGKDVYGNTHNITAIDEALAMIMAIENSDR